LLAPAGRPDPMGSPVVVWAVPARPPAEAGTLRPPVDADRSGDGAHDGRDAAPDHPETGVELADVVEQRGGEPARLSRVLAAGQARLDEARDADRVPPVVVRERAPQPELGGLEDAGHPRHVPLTRSPRPEGADETASEVESPR